MKTASGTGGQQFVSRGREEETGDEVILLLHTRWEPEKEVTTFLFSSLLSARTVLRLPLYVLKKYYDKQ